MPNWNQILDELRETGGACDVVRRKYVKTLHEVTKRNIIVYYSGWLQKPNVTSGQEINDSDKNGLMAVIHRLDRTKGLDLVLHTPGGDIAATESIVDYLISMFNHDIRVIVPQLAMSAGTMIACASKQIIMGKQSSLGPIDPQFGNMAAHGIIEEFNRAYTEIKEDSKKALLWQPIIAKYAPTLVGECEKALKWSEALVRSWLGNGMFKDTESILKKETIDKILNELGNHGVNLSHNRHISLAKAKEIGLLVTTLEEDAPLQDAALSVHHAAIHTLSATNAIKIIENHIGTSFIQSVHSVVVKN